MQKVDYLIVDSNNLGFRLYAMFLKSRGGLLKNSVGIPTTVIYGFLRALEAFTRKIEVEKTILCWDIGGGSRYRKKIFPHYKANRDHKDLTEYFEELDSAREYLGVFGVPQAVGKGLEADDIVGWLAHNLTQNGCKAIILSDDCDYSQLVNKNISLYRPIKERVIGYKDVIEEYKCKPHLIPRIWALTGQDKDNIPGACNLNEHGVMQKYGFGPAKAYKLLEENNWNFHDVYDALNSNVSGLREDFVQQLLDNWKQVKLSYKLARIRTKNIQYKDWELDLLEDLHKDIISDTSIKSSNVIQLADFLDFKSLNIIKTLRNLGVNIVGKGQQKVATVKV